MTVGRPRSRTKPPMKMLKVPLCKLGHINNLYNTAFWALIQLGGLDNKEAEKTLAVPGPYPRPTSAVAN